MSVADQKLMPATALSAAAGVVMDEGQFAQDVALMLKSGLTLLDSIKTLRERCDARHAGLLERLMRAMREGQALSGAMQTAGGFKPTLVACVKSSELTGDLPDSLERYAINVMRVRAVRAKLISALVYPAMLVGVTLMVVLFLLTFVVPRFAAVLEGSGHDLPVMSRWLIVTGKFLDSLPLVVWLALAALLAWGVWLLIDAARSGRLETMMSEAAGRVPGLRELVRRFAISQLVRSTAMLVRSGLPALKALGMSRELLLADDRARLDLVLKQVSNGAPLAAALSEHGLVDAMGQRVLRVAEQTGQLHQALERLADIHDQDLERGIERAGRLIEPALMLVIGLLVGGIVVLMYLPIFQLAASIG